MDPAFSPEELASLYRFALLLTGSGPQAAAAVVEACTECAPRLESYRNAAGRAACLLAHVRESCLRKKQPAAATVVAPDDLPSGAGAESGAPVAAQISALPEPERSALALFYTAPLPAREIAALLKISLEELSARLQSARRRLRETGQLAGAPDAVNAEAAR